MLINSVLSLLLVATASGLAESSSTATPPKNETINWFSCDQNTTMPVTCGTLAVPLDYTNPGSDNTLTLQLLKFNATNQPAKGSILFNPGGPGDSTREFLANYAEQMMIATSGHYNLIAFDTRGVGETLPFSCFDTPTDRARFYSLAPTTTNDSDTSLGLTWSLGTVLAKACYVKNKEIGELMSTAFIARDMMQIVDNLGEDGLLRYYGFSYGTVLGATAAAMFPDRVDKIILDGVVNVHEWLYGSNEQETLQADQAIRAYFKSCLDEPDTCAIQRKNATADELYDEVIQLLEEIKYNPIVLGDDITTSIVQYGPLKNAIFTFVKEGMLNARPLSVYLNAIMERNLTAYDEALTVFSSEAGSIIYPSYGPEAIYGIQCSDTELRSYGLEGIQSIVEYNYIESYYVGPPVTALLIACAQWKMRSKETFTGPFRVRTKNPILFISSPYDPVTPMASARNMSQDFEGSVLLQQNGIGHCSLAQPSTCTIKATSAYFLNGTLPSDRTICEPDFGLLSNHTLQEVYQSAARQTIATVLIRIAEGSFGS